MYTTYELQKMTVCFSVTVAVRALTSNNGIIFLSQVGMLLKIDFLSLFRSLRGNYAMEDLWISPHKISAADVCQSSLSIMCIFISL